MSTFAVLKSNVSKELGLDETASGDEDVLLGRRLNAAVREFLTDTLCYVTPGSASLTAATYDYDLQTGTSFLASGNTNILEIDAIIDSNNIPFERVTVDQIRELRRASGASSNSTQRRYALSGANLLMVWPTPQANETVTLYYVPRPTEMSSAANDPSSPTYGGIPQEFHEALEKWACWYMASYDDDVSSAQGDRYLGQYQLQVNKARKMMRLKGGRRQPRVQLGRRTVVSSDPART